MRRDGWAVVVLLLGLWPALAAARVTLEATLGLQGTVRLEKWNPVTVTVHNLGPPLVGTLGVRVWRGSEFRGDLHVVTFTRQVELPHRARKRYVFTVPVASISHPVEVSLSTPAGLVAQKRLDLRRALHAEHLILGVTRTPDLEFLAPLAHRHTRIVYVMPQALPRQWSGYDSVTAVVLKGVSLQALSEAQFTALRQWLARGGTLIVAADAQFRLLQEPRLQALLPVQVVGLQRRQGLPALATHYGVPLPPVPLMVVTSHLVAGAVTVGTPEQPLLAQRPFGKGRVVFLAIDYAALAGWQGNRALWRDLLQLDESVDYGRLFAELGLLDEAHPVLKALNRPLFTYPSHLTLGLFLLAYGGTLGVCFWQLGKKRGRRRAYVSIVGAGIVGFSLAAVQLPAERTLQHAAVLFDLSTVEVLSDTGYAHVRGYLGLFAVRGGEYALALRSPTAVMHHTFARGVGTAGTQLEFGIAETATIRHLGLGAWTLRVFSVESLTSAPLQVTATPHPLGLSLRLRNQGPFPLEGATLVYRGKLFPLGSLAPGQEIDEDIYPELQPAERPQEALWQALLRRHPTTADTRLATLQEVLLQHYFGDRRLTEAQHSPLLVAWSLAPATLAPGRLPVRAVALVISELPG
ncbi:MAG: hypothetical protein KatS3mg131_0663 [Candidatus Tectimicrobiota bacterium]|nr:MAG: hypothetical protein KatS3mg131_0663 [Candidatus Tectomicrobia bacterium]